VLLAVVLVLLLAYTAGELLNDTGHVRLPAARARNDRRGTYASAVGWPQQGQAALVLGNGRPAATPGERPVPIASLAKVMTAYLTLQRYPLSGAQDGFMITITAAQADAAARDAAENQSDVAVAVGEQLTERQLLQALLIPSGNNIAQILAAHLAGSEPSFVEEMNAEARMLGMDHTTYTDPSGFDPSTVSTAADQLRVFEQAMRFPVFRQIVSTPSVTLPIAGTLTNFNPLIADGYAGKTGSDSAAGGVPGVLHPGDRRRSRADRGRRGDGAGAGERHVGDPRRGRPGRTAVGRVRRPGGRQANDHRVSRGWCLQPGRPIAAVRSRSPGLDLMPTQTTICRRTRE
jgi:hypothetical protein